MINSIKYFEENSIKIFEKLETDFMNAPTKVAELVRGVTTEVHKLGLRIIQEYLYIEADEDHIALQFNKRKGDLEIGTNGRKNNYVISKLVYVHEGLKPESIINTGTEDERNSKRWELISPHYFCRVCNGKENELYWDEIFNWINNHYDLAKITVLLSILIFSIIYAPFLKYQYDNSGNNRSPHKPYQR